MARPSIFGPKDGGNRIHVLSLTERGRQLFEAARKRIGKLAHWKGDVSDADTIDYLVRGDEETKKYLKAKE